MTVNLGTQLQSILGPAEDDLGPLAASPLDAPAAAQIRRIIANASPAIRYALASSRRLKTVRNADVNSASRRCGTGHKQLGSPSRMVDRSLERRGAQA